MKEADRKARNSQRLTEMDDPMGVVVRRVLNRMEAQGFRPRIQEAFRTPADQLKAFLSGHSKVKFGFHNVTGAGGVKESLAADVLDDDHPLGPPTRYMLALAIAAHAEGVHTGISFSLPAKLAAGVAAAIADGDINRKVKVGFDPTHVEPVGITIAQAKAGKRPTFGAASAKKAVAKKAAAGGQKFHVVVRGETLFGIAKQFSLTPTRILELNPQKRANPNFLKIGEKIRVAIRRTARGGGAGLPDLARRRGPRLGEGTVFVDSSSDARVVPVVFMCHPPGLERTVAQLFEQR